MYIARQPIFNDNMDVYGYELLFRKSAEDTSFGGVSFLHATANVVTNVFESGVAEIVGDKKAFINFDDEFFRYALPDLLSPSQLVIELLETTKKSKRAYEILATMKTQGYLIALDDYVTSEDAQSYMGLADIIKVDILNASPSQIYQAIAHAKAEKKLLLAEKVESQEVFEQIKHMGFSLFQGYFFSKPSIVNHSKSKHSTILQYQRLMEALKEEEPSYQLMAEIIEKDIGLSYKLMRIVGNRVGTEQVYSVKRALTFIGLNELERWLSILLLQELGEVKSQELMTLSLVRSKLCSDIARDVGLGNFQHEAGLLGLFSVIDAYLDEPMETILTRLPLTQQIKEALLYQSGNLAPVLLMMMAYEKADWQQVDRLIKLFRLKGSVITMDYLKAIRWAEETIAILSGKGEVS